MSLDDPWRGVARIPPDIAWIEPGFGIGCRPFAAQRAAIRGLGVDTVITLHAPNDAEAAGWTASGVELLAFPTRDVVGIPVDRFDAVVDAVLAQREAGRTVLLHCLAGINRAPTVAAAVLCRRDGLSVAEALARVRAARPSASPTPEQLASLRAWVRSITSGRSPDW